MGNSGEVIHSEPSFFDDASSIVFLIQLSSRVYEGIRATTYVKRFNKNLTNALGLESLYTSLQPVIDYDGNLAMTFNVSMKL